MKIKNKSGFTLVEILMVVTIISILGVSVIASFVSGLRIWKYAKDLDSKDSAFLTASLEWGKDLRQALNQSGGIVFEGGPKSFSFPAINNGEIFRINYYFDPSSKKVFRGRVSIKELLSGSGLNGEEKQFLFNADDFSASYFIYDKKTKRYVWVDSLGKSADTLKAVRIFAKIKDNNYAREVFLPIAEGQSEAPAEVADNYVVYRLL
jgi:prepilin-type N-terminal cleavage/methylation domain-containing protein